MEAAMRLAQLVTFSFAIAAANVAWAQAKYSYLHDATNAIFQIRSTSVQPSAAEVARIAAIGCNALDRLLKDDDFQTDLKRAASSVGTHAKYHEGLRKDLRQFVSSFLQIEGKLLKEAGVSDEAARDILSSAGFLRDAIGNKTDPAKLVADITALRNDLCSAATSMHKEGEDARAQAQRMERIIKWGLSLGGVTMIIVDIPAMVPSAGVATASFTLGSVLVSSGIAK
jgi:hypothetical protein